MNFMNSIIIKDIQHIGEAAREFISQIGSHRVFAFYGTMGAGKTTFVKAVCEQLGVSDVITSPTFAIVNEYTIPSDSPCLRGDTESSPCGENFGGSVFHFDFYRIKKLEEVYDMGYEDYFYSGALCFIEWPELIEEILPTDAVRVSISEQDDHTRLLTF